jgi:diguanylate cyclase (GGDEF)-like protein/PAS domain S-box-containing protein
VIMRTRKRTSNQVVEILVVEDSPTQAEELKFLLEQQNYSVTVATNGREALKVMHERKPTLVITDIVMPKMDGYALCSAIKSDQALKEIPVVIVTSLSSIRDIAKSLECGADNFIRKPYDPKTLIARIDYILLNIELRKHKKVRIGMEVILHGKKHFINSEREQIIDLLISTYEEAVHMNEELQERQKEIARSHQTLGGLYRIAGELNRVSTEADVCDRALQGAMEMPNFQAGWIFLQDEHSGFRHAAGCNLPATMSAPGAMETDCRCRRMLLAGDIPSSTNIMECERLQNGAGNGSGLRFHASTPLMIDNRCLGIMNLAGTEGGSFADEDIKILDAVGSQLAVALERARLYQHLEALVAQRTVALQAELVERKRAEAGLRESESLKGAILESALDCLMTIDHEGKIVEFTPAAEVTFGFTRQAALGKSMAELIIPPGLRDAHHRGFAHYLATGEGPALGKRLELTAIRADGTEFPIELAITAIKSRSTPLFTSCIRDITERKSEQEKIKRLTRIHEVLSGINSAIVRIRDRGELFRAACDVAVTKGVFAMAWIGEIDPNTLDGKVVAWSGGEKAYVEQIRLTAHAGRPDSDQPACRALRGLKPVICNDVSTDPTVAPLRAELLAQGYHSIVAFPLLVEQRALAVLALFAREVDFFDREEMNLLTELAEDIAFGLEYIAKEKQLDYLAHFDPLTGLPNRMLFYDSLKSALAQAEKRHWIVAVLFLDIDRFKNINDTLGHALGDELLRQVGNRLLTCLRIRDTVGRLGGDEFTLILVIPDGPQGAVVVANKIREALRQPFDLEGHEVITVTASIGITVYPTDSSDPDTLIKYADTAMYQAKEAGRDTYRFYTAEMNARVQEKLDLENAMRKALDNGEFVLYYQPKMEINTGRWTGVEALIRWNRPGHGLVQPADFIPILEETGLIVPVGAWVIDTACKQIAEWQRSGTGSICVAVNLSGKQFLSSFDSDAARAARDGSVDPVLLELEVAAARAIRASRIDPKLLELELTESTLMSHAEGTIAVLRRLKTLGIRISIDDFGTGYSSLAYLKRFPIDTLKIDLAFIRDVTTNADDAAITVAIISMAHSLKLKVIAEGVETKEQLEFLRSHDCDEIQGYYLSRPLPAIELARLYQETHASSAGTPGISS